MELKKEAQENLFKKLGEMEIKAHQEPEYNNYKIEAFGYFQDDLNKLYDQFIKELNDNLTSRHPSFELYLQDILKTLEKITVEIYAYHKEEIYETHKHNPEAFTRNKLGYIDNFLNFQKQIIHNTINQIEQKLSLVSDPAIFKPQEKASTHTQAPLAEANMKSNMPAFKTKLISPLNRKDLTVLFWMLSECDFFEFDTNKQLADFLEENVLYTYEDEKTKESSNHEMSSIAELLSQLKDNTHTRSGPSQLKILQKLRDVFNQYESSILSTLENTPLPLKDPPKPKK